MNATIETRSNKYTETIDKGGLFRKATTVEKTAYSFQVFVDFSEEERAILSQYNLWEAVLWTEQLPAPHIEGVPDTPIYRNATIKDIGSPINMSVDVLSPAYRSSPGELRVFDSSAEALNFRHDLTTKILPHVKQLIGASNEFFGKTETLTF